ncbi:hypothetical protein ACFXJQ_50405, partial [Streptomyces sp. NPDC059349]
TTAQLKRVLGRACHDSILSNDRVSTESGTVQSATNTDQRQVDWQFTTHDARIKLRHLYPKH